MQQRRFPGTRLSHQRHKFAGPDYQVEILEDNYIFASGSKDLRQILRP
jgi:hypothetical protein